MFFEQGNPSTNRAKIIVLEGKLKRVVYGIQFNPVEYTVESTNNYESKKLIRLKDVLTQYNGGERSDLTLELMFDSTDLGVDVHDMIFPLIKISRVDAELHAPPPCLFIWGKFIFKGVVSKLTKQYIFFYASGIPGRVKVTLTLKPYKTPDEILANNEMHSSDLSKLRRVDEGDNLWLMAFREYENSGDWRLIAKKNDIENPLLLENGIELILPPKDET